MTIYVQFNDLPNIPDVEICHFLLYAFISIYIDIGIIISRIDSSLFNLLYFFNTISLEYSYMIK